MTVIIGEKTYWGPCAEGGVDIRDRKQTQSCFFCRNTTLWQIYYFLGLLIVSSLNKFIFHACYMLGMLCGKDLFGRIRIHLIKGCSCLVPSSCFIVCEIDWKLERPTLSSF